MSNGEGGERAREGGTAADPARLEVFKHLLSSVADEMGTVLRRSAFSPNIKERRDYSCAVFDGPGHLVAQAAHIPVHLGAMPLSVEACIEALTLAPGDVAILNDPYRGGTHLPDITLVTPAYGRAGTLLGYVASRAHHADVGGATPGSLPLATQLSEEGVVIPPSKLVESGKTVREVWDRIMASVRTPDERAGDLRAQLAAGETGARRLRELEGRYGRRVGEAMAALLRYSERMTRRLIAELPDGTYRFRDRLDPDDASGAEAEVAVAMTIHGEEIEVDFTGSSPQQSNSLNAVYAVTVSAVAYVVRSLVGLDIPANSGCLAPVRIVAPEGTIVNARPPAAVSAGNVETSQRITDVLLGALAAACPDRVPAASQGTMNNLTIGGWDPFRDRTYAYYETIGGGTGAGSEWDGVSAIQSHMTNTLNTPVEALEYAYPVRIRRYEVRRGSGGEGRRRGGDGIRRDIEFLAPTRVTVISDRRVTAAYGLAGGSPGKRGENVLLRTDGQSVLPGRFSRDVEAGDVLSLRTPGGGGFGPIVPRPTANRQGVSGGS